MIFTYKGKMSHNFQVTAYRNTLEIKQTYKQANKQNQNSAE